MPSQSIYPPPPRWIMPPLAPRYPTIKSMGILSRRDFKRMELKIYATEDEQHTKNTTRGLHQSQKLEQKCKIQAPARGKHCTTSCSYTALCAQERDTRSALEEDYSIVVHQGETNGPATDERLDLLRRDWKQAYIGPKQGSLFWWPDLDLGLTLHCEYLCIRWPCPCAVVLS